MRYVASYLLAVLGGNTTPTSADLERILDTVGIECDLNRLEKVLAQLDGKSIEKIICDGRDKLCSITAGVAPVIASITATAPVEGEKKDTKEEEEKEESEESDEDMGFGLFD